jgi:hypothetical protein
MPDHVSQAAQKASGSVVPTDCPLITDSLETVISLSPQAWAAGRPVLVHMGTPNSRHLYGPNRADAAERGPRLTAMTGPATDVRDPMLDAPSLAARRSTSTA